MNSRQAIKLALDSGDMVGLKYLEDLTDEEMMRRPCPGCNHINWQIGHLILAENNLISKIAPGKSPSLPTGFAEKYSKEATTNDDPKAFLKKDELLKMHRQQRAATLALLDSLGEEQLDSPTGFDFAPTTGALISMQGSHWLMHCGQWAVVRRQLGRKPVI